MDIFETNKILLFVIFFIPGFISIKIWHLLNPSHRIEATTYILEAISYSCINYAISFPLLIVLNKGIKSGILWYHYGIISLVLFIFPIIWPFIYLRITSSKKMQGIIIHPIPKAWDYFFKRGEICFMLIHLKSGDLLGGYYGSESFASSYPAEEDLYLQQVLEVDENGCFGDPIEDSKGLLINYHNIDYIELFNASKEVE